jgi:hypothetical protein
MLELEEDRDLGWLLMILLDYVDFTIRRNRKIAVFAKKCGKLSCYKAIKLPEKNHEIQTKSQVPGVSIAHCSTCN